MRTTSLTLESVTASATGAVEFVFRPDRRFRHRPGHAGLVLVPGGGAKPFTFSSDARADLISITTSLRSGSRFKRALAQLQPGDRVRAVGPIGSPPAVAPGEPQVLVAQGIGITPFLAMARSSACTGATLLQVGTPHHFAETAAAMTTAEHHDHRNDLHDALRRTLAARPDARWSLSGRAEFVAGTAQRLVAAGVPARRIHKDAFWGWRATSRDVAQPHPLVHA